MLTEVVKTILSEERADEKPDSHYLLNTAIQC